MRRCKPPRATRTTVNRLTPRQDSPRRLGTDPAQPVTVLNYRIPPMPESNPSHLPRAEEAWIPGAKLKDYALKLDHSGGGDKARVFRSVLALGSEDWEYLRDQILEGVHRHPVTRTRSYSDGEVDYAVVIDVVGLNGVMARVTTGWIVDPGSPPRLTSAYIARKHLPR
jgi:hypothetical protein